MDEGSEEFKISKPYSFVSYFKKTMRPGDVECCHFSNKDCNQSGDAESLLDFRVTFGNTPEISFPCSAGGGLVITGSRNESSTINLEATCNHPDGTVSIHLAI
ncbi:hypothetical protein BD770DRAFT_415941 [Pilaira anomala]|nr:hypothetical protein BD770DRAFT_415941 [Pilaira anomala]